MQQNNNSHICPPETNYQFKASSNSNSNTSSGNSEQKQKPLIVHSSFFSSSSGKNSGSNNSGGSNNERTPQICKPSAFQNERYEPDETFSVVDIASANRSEYLPLYPKSTATGNRHLNRQSEQSGIFSCIKQIFEEQPNNRDNASVVANMDETRSPMISNILSIPDSIDQGRKERKNDRVSENINFHQKKPSKLDEFKEIKDIRMSEQIDISKEKSQRSQKAKDKRKKREDKAFGFKIQEVDEEDDWGFEKVKPKKGNGISMNDFKVIGGFVDKPKAKKNK